MAMRRRIKVGVNLSAAKRKKPESNEHVEEKPKPKPILENDKVEVNQNESTTSSVAEMIPKTEFPSTETKSDDAAFKFPPKVEFNRSNSHTATPISDESNRSDVDDGVQVMQMDLQQSANGFQINSLTKTQRQRIKPTPIFGQRRNSAIGPSASPASPLSNDDIVSEPAATQRRERHFSGSQNHISSLSHVPFKPPCRTRTESTCSVFSDSHMSSTSKTRKTDHDHGTNHHRHTRRDFEARFSKGVPDKSSLKMFDLIYYNPVTNPMEQKSKTEEIKTETKEEPSANIELGKNDDKSSVPVPQLKLNAKGELILDDKSLEIETTAEQEARKVLAKSSLIYLDENTGMNGFYKRQKRTRDWPPDETVRFYRCLQTIGTDFSMMCQLFPNRTRRDIKLKFKKEERCNGPLINKALLHPNSFNIQELKDQFETEDRQREEEERSKVKIQYKKVQIKTSKSARALKNADDIYNQELLEIQAKKKSKRKVKMIEKSPEKIKNKNQSKSVNKTEKSQESQDKDRENQSPCKTELKFEELPQSELSQSSSSEHSHTTNQQNEPSLTITPDEPMSDDAKYTEMYSRNEVTDHLNPSNYMDGYAQAHNNNYDFMPDENTENSRTFVNMDSGHLTLIRETQAFYTENISDGGGNSIMDNNEYMNNNVTRIRRMSIEECISIPMTENNMNMNDIEGQTRQYSASYTESITAEENHSEELSEIITSSNTINDEKEILRILEDIANGSLVVVSSYNPTTPDDSINEVYMVDQNTGELCDEPLDLPQDLVQSILSVMT